MVRNGIGASNSGGNKVTSIYEMGIKSASSTVGVANRRDPNSLHFASKEETLKMHNTGDMVTAGGGGQTSATTTMQTNRDGASGGNNLHRSMNFRRQSKELRANSAKWAKKQGNGGAASISHMKSPNQTTDKVAKA